MIIEVEIPEDANLGDLIMVRGALFDASATFVDWEALANPDNDLSEAISPAGRILCSIASQLNDLKDPVT